MGDGKVISSAKHFLSDGATQNGVDQGDALISEEELINVHAAGYYSAIPAGVQTVMASFSSWQGRKLHGDKELLTDVLKGKMGFNGFVIGDWNGHGQVKGCTNTSCPQAFNAGVDIFAELNFNSKHSNQNGTYEFANSLNIYDVNGHKTSEEAINRLTKIQRLYVLTSSSTASASEMIINGLKAFIPVKVIGTTTYGKNVGSITLYDSPSSDYTNAETANSNHLYAMQPIVFQIYNKLGQSDYIQGFNPDIEVKEYQFWANILPFGDENEVVLKAALNDIRGVSAKSLPPSFYKNIKELEVLPLEKRFEKEMYLDEDFLSR